MYGPHLILEGYDSPKRKLNSVGYIYRTLDEFPALIGMTKIMPPHVQKHLTPGNPSWGVSGFVIIAESHIAIHTYPELGFFALDVFSCKDFDVEKAVKFCVKRFGLTRYDHKLLNRGEDYPKDIEESGRIVCGDRRKFRKSSPAAV
ncbi:MAG: adenosylmethionine decarboxylase [bacterium]